MRCRLNRRWRYEHETPNQQDMAVRGGASPLTFAAPTGFRSGNDYLRQLADEYVRKNMHEFGLPHYQETPRQPLNHKLGYMTADAFDQLQHNPQDPAVQAAYRALGKETTAQFNHLLQNGFKIEPWMQPGQPYQNSREMAQDVAGKHIWYFPTINPNEPASFGDAGADLDPNNNLLLQKTGHNINGHELTVNDAFRAVHDIYGHAKDGFEFGPEGEYNAFVQHRKMFSPLAQRALATETHGQNSWVNFGHHLRGVNGLVAQKGQEGYIHPMARPYAAQKMALLHENIVPPHPYLPPPEIKLNVPPKKLKFQRVREQLQFANAVRKGAIKPKIGNYNPNLFSGDIHAIQVHMHALCRKPEEVWDSRKEVMAKAFAKVVGRPPSNYKAPMQNALSSSLSSAIMASPYEKPDPLSYEVAAGMMHDDAFHNFSNFADQAARRVMMLMQFQPHKLFTHVPGMGLFEDKPEPSLTTVFHSPVSPLQLQRMAAAVGHRANQLSVLNFNVHNDGPNQLYHARIKTHNKKEPLSPQLMGSISKKLYEMFLEHDLYGGTILPDTTGHSDILVYNHGTSNEDKQKEMSKFVKLVSKLPTENGAGPRFWNGTGMFLGDMDDRQPDAFRRENARNIYTQAAAEKTPRLPAPQTMVSEKLQRAKEKLRLMGGVPHTSSELNDILHGWIENPADNAYKQQIVPDFLQETEHPLANLHDWYWNWAVPDAMGQTQYPHDEYVSRLTANENMSAAHRNMLRGTRAITDNVFTPNGYRDPLKGEINAHALVGTALIRGLKMPRLKGTLLDAVYKHYSPEIAQKVHGYLLRTELLKMGLLDPKQTSTPSLVTKNDDTHAMYRNIKHIAGSQPQDAYLYRINNGQYIPNDSHEDSLSAMPIVRGLDSFYGQNELDERHKNMHAVAQGVHNFGVSADAHFGDHKRQQMNRTGTPMQLAEVDPRVQDELNYLMHGWMDNPDQSLHQTPTVSNFLQETGHPSSKLFDWYYHKALPEVANTPYASRWPSFQNFPRLPNRGLALGGSMYDFLSGQVAAKQGLREIPTDGIDTTGVNNKLAPLVGTSLIRGLNLPKLKGNLLNAVYKVYGANSGIADYFHTILLSKELKALGLLDEKTPPVIQHKGALMDGLMHNLNSMTQNRYEDSAADNSSSYLFRLRNGRYKKHGTGIDTALSTMPITTGFNESDNEHNRTLKTIGTALGKFGESAKATFGEKPKQMSRTGTPVQMAGGVPSTPQELNAITRGWLENPQDLAYPTQLIPDMLQELDHPAYPTWNWYWNKALPAVQGVQYPSTNNYGDRNKAIDDHVRAINPFFKHIPKNPYLNPAIDRSSFLAEGSNKSGALIGSALIRALSLPRFRGNLLAAFDKHMPQIAKLVHQRIAQDELMNVGVVDPATVHNSMFDITNVPDYYKGLIPAEGRTLAAIHNITGADFNSPFSNIGSLDHLVNYAERGHPTYRPMVETEYSNEFPVPASKGGPIGEAVRQKNSSAIYKGSTTMMQSGAQHFNPESSKMSMLQFGQHAPAGSGAVVRGVFYPPGKMMPTLETAPQPAASPAPKIPAVQQPLQPQKPMQPAAPPVVPMQTTVQPPKKPNSTPFLDKARSFIKRKNVRLG